MNEGRIIKCIAEEKPTHTNEKEINVLIIRERGARLFAVNSNNLE